MIETLYEPFRHWSSEGTIWLYSDPHFNEDEDLKKPFPNRPTAEEQIKMINSKVGRKDTLIILGDIGDIECAKKLRGHKILVKGNHDKGLSNYEEVFEEIYGGPVMIADKIILSHEPLGVKFAYNIHGHDHMGKQFTSGGMNVCSDVIGYTPVSFNQFIKSGHLKEVETIHRDTIDRATIRAKKRKTGL